jgi:L-fuculose-phosphate aldolase
VRKNRLKKMLVACGREIGRGHLVMGAMGNISARAGQIIWIKRGGAWLQQAKSEDFVAVDIRSGRPLRAQLPSKEVFLHLGCYRARADIGAVVHTHPVMTTALATVGLSLEIYSPALFSKLGGPTAILRYYDPGSQKLARQVQQAVKKANAVMLANHGLVTVGRDIRQAYRRTILCEQAAKRILVNLKK